MEWQPEVHDGMNAGAAEIDFEYLKFTEFRKANLPTFQGTFNLDKAEEWIKAIKKIFSVLACTEQ